MTDFRSENEEYAAIGRELIETEDSLLRIRNSDVTICYLSSQHKKVSSGNVVFGQCEKIADKYKWGIPCDFTITIFEPNVAEFQFDDYQIRQLIHHELLHVGIEPTENGEKYSIIPHDLEDFRLILSKYGIDWNRPGGGKNDGI